MNRPSTAQRESVRTPPARKSAVMYQTWDRLLLLHWACRPEVIQQTLPNGLFVDTFDGSAFIGVTPFFMRAVRPRFGPALPYLSDFLELNVRTYVYDREGRPGVWFYSLDCNRWLAVIGARWTYCLPYFSANMSAQTGGKRITYTSARVPAQPHRTARFVYSIKNVPHSIATPESLEFFLVERYLLFSRCPRTGTLWSALVAHPPHQLVDVDLEWWDQTMLRINGFSDIAKQPCHVTLSTGVRTAVFAPERIPATTS